MGLLEAIALGAVQGLTEFLPISSSGHLILVPWLLGYILLGSIPGGLVGLKWNDFIEENFGKPYQIALALVAFGLLLYFTDRLGKKMRDDAAFGWRDALIVGTAQALALFPGVSRSGITITAGLALGFRRDCAATFSFLLATPITGGAVLWAAVKLLRGGVPVDERIPVLAWVAGVVVSGVVGLLVIHG